MRTAQPTPSARSAANRNPQHDWRETASGFPVAVAGLKVAPRYSDFRYRRTGIHHDGATGLLYAGSAAHYKMYAYVRSSAAPRGSTRKSASISALRSPAYRNATYFLSAVRIPFLTPPARCTVPNNVLHQAELDGRSVQVRGNPGRLGLRPLRRGSTCWRRWNGVGVVSRAGAPAKSPKPRPCGPCAPRCAAVTG